MQKQKIKNQLHILRVSLAVLLLLSAARIWAPVQSNPPVKPPVTQQQSQLRPRALSHAQAINRPAGRQSPSLIPLSSNPSPNLPAASHPNYPYTALLTPNDTYFPSEWYMNKISAPEAWDVTTAADSPIIAVIDTGFALDHQDLTGHWYTNPGEIGATNVEGPAPNCTSRGLALDKSCNNLDNDGDGYASDWRGWDFSANDNDPRTGTTNASASAAFHGSYVAGLIGAQGNNGQGVAGVAWGAKLMPLQALDDTGNGYTDTVAAAVRYAADHGAQIISMSLGSTYDDAYLRQQVDYAISKGAVVVAAAGNSGCECLSYPANYPEVVAVGATDSNDLRASFSSYGANLDVMAPGTDGICSVFWSAADTTSGYACGYSGTSFSTPIVSGLLGLALAHSPTSTPSDLQHMLIAGAVKVPAMSGASFSSQYGYGRVDAASSVLLTSLPVPQEQLGGKQSAGSISLAANPEMASVCQSLPGAPCSLHLTGPSGQIITLPAKIADHWGGVVFYWRAADAGLTAGDWQIDSVNGLGQISDFASAFVTISP